MTSLHSCLSCDILPYYSIMRRGVSVTALDCTLERFVA